MQERKTGQFGDLIAQELRKKSEDAAGRGLRSETLHNYDIDQFYPETPKCIRDSFNFFEMNEEDDAITANVVEKKHSVAGRVKSLSLHNVFSASNDEDDKNSTQTLSVFKCVSQLLTTFVRPRKALLHKVSSSSISA